MLTNILPSGTPNPNNEISDAVNMATDFVNAYATHYDTFDDYSSSPETVNAPLYVGMICRDVAKVFYMQLIGEVYRDGGENATWQTVLNAKKQELANLTIEPVWVEQAIVLDSNNSMIIGDRNNGGSWPRVIPWRSEIIETGGSQFFRPDDFEIIKGGINQDDYPEAWYLTTANTQINGHTLRYMRTFRNDGMDYARYQD